MSGQEFYDKEMARLKADNERLRAGLGQLLQGTLELQANAELLRKMLVEATRFLETVVVEDINSLKQF